MPTTDRTICSADVYNAVRELSETVCEVIEANKLHVHEIKRLDGNYIQVLFILPSLHSRIIKKHIKAITSNTFKITEVLYSKWYAPGRMVIQFKEIPSNTKD